MPDFYRVQKDKIETFLASVSENYDFEISIYQHI